MSYATLADLVLVLHLCYVGFVVIGLLLILVGACLGWNWVRNPWFRSAHLLAMAIVVFEASLGIQCPLTTWEYQYRKLADHDISALEKGPWNPSDISYPLYVLRGFLFPGAALWVYLPIYLAIMLMIVASLVFAPPRWRRVSHSLVGTVHPAAAVQP